MTAFNACGHEFTRALTKALGLEDRMITSLTLKLDMESVVTVELTELAECHDTGELESLTGKYEVHEVTEAPA